MSDNAQRFGQEAVEFLEHLEREWGTDFQLGVVGLIAEIVIIVDDAECSVIDFGISDDRRWAQVGFLRAALKSAEAQLETVELEGD